jgi:hypothetical protein
MEGSQSLLGKVTSQSPGMEQISQHIREMGPTDVSVLIQGEPSRIGWRSTVCASTPIQRESRERESRGARRA